MQKCTCYEARVKRLRFEKILFTMKLSLILLCLALQVSATNYGQNVISLREENISLTEIFKKIEKRSPYRFYFSSDALPQRYYTSVYANNASLSEVMDKVLRGVNLSWKELSGNRIVVAEPQASALGTAAKQIITGTVTDDKGSPLSNVSVIIKGTGTGITTSETGRFSITANTGDVLVFSIVGYETREVTIADQDKLDIVLLPVDNRLNEVVVVGYGTQKRENITGAVASVKMDDLLGNRPTSTVASVLQGTIPGLQVTIGSGEPGAGASFNVRGVTDLNTSGTSLNTGGPLILVDNVPFNGGLNLLDPADIETVTLLKDAGSAAIYGGRSAFGVLLITTKKGTKSAKPQFLYSNNITFSKPQNLPQKATPLQTIQAYKDMGTIGYWTGQNVDTWLQLMEDYTANPQNYPDGYVYVNKIRYPLSQTDAVKDLLGNRSLQQIHNFSVNGGTEKTTYRLSAGLTNQKGIIAPKSDQDRYKRYNIKSVVASDITSWLNTSLDAAYYRSEKKYPFNNDQFGLASNLPPYVKLTDTITASNGNRGIIGSPRQLMEMGYPTTTVNNDIRVSGNAILKPFEGFTVTGQYTYDYLMTSATSYSKPYAFVNVSNFAESNGGTGRYSLSDASTYYKALNIYGQYKKMLGNHNLGLTAGYNQETNAYEEKSVSRDGMISIDFPSISQATGVLIANNAISEYSLRGWFGKLNYDFAGKYLLELSGRYDGSSKFPTHHRFGFFPSASLGWNILKEEFMSFLKPALSDFRIRASFGQVGNQNIAPYQFVPTMNSFNPGWLIGTTSLLTTLSTPGLISSSFTWATVQTQNIGVDFAAFKNRLTGSFDWYKRETKDILASGAVPLPAVLGTGAPLKNTASVASSGYEAQINWRDRIGDVTYYIGANLYDFKGKVTKFDGNPTGALSSYYVGQQLGEIWGYMSDRFYTVDDFVDGTVDQNFRNGTLKPGTVRNEGQNPNPGDMKFVDLNGDSVINTGANTLANPGDRKVIGNSSIRFQYGVLGGVSYKNFDFSFVIQGVGKQDLWINSVLTQPNSYAFGTIYSHQLDYWTPENTDAFYARIYDQAAGNQSSNQRIQSRYLINGAYLRVKNLTLSYNVPSGLLERIKTKRLSVFYSIENPWTFDHLPKGLDPTLSEKQWGLGYPMLRMSSVGINLQF